MLFFYSAIFSALLQLVAHLAVRLYAPKLGLIPRYVMGTVSLLLPPTLLFGWDAAQPYWLCAVIGGGAVVGAYWIGDRIIQYQDAKDAAELAKLTLDEGRHLLERVRHAKKDQED